jgi:hypothetical protein
MKDPAPTPASVAQVNPEYYAAVAIMRAVK